METIPQILEKILPVFAALGIGMFCRKRHILSVDGMSQIKRIVVNFTLPAVLLSAFASADYSSNIIRIALWIFFCCCLALALGYASRKLFKNSPRLTPYLCTGYEGGMLGFALYPLISSSLAPLAILELGQVFFVFTVYKLLLSGASDRRSLVKEAVSTPVLWALLIGILIGASGLHKAMEPSGAQAVFDSLLSYISAPTGFLILVSVGYELEPSKISWGKTLSVLATRMIIMACLLYLTLFLNQRIFAGAIDTYAAILFFALPAPFVLPVFTDDEKEFGFISSTLSVMTCFTIIVFSCMVLFMGQ